MPGPISMTDPLNLLTVLVQFGPSQDGAVERDLGAAIERIKAERDAARARAEKAEAERDEARKAGARILKDRDKWRSEAEAAESRAAALSAQVERMREARTNADMELESLLHFCHEANAGRQPSDAREFTRRVGMTLDKFRAALAEEPADAI